MQENVCVCVRERERERERERQREREREERAKRERRERKTGLMLTMRGILTNPSAVSDISTRPLYIIYVGPSITASIVFSEQCGGGALWEGLTVVLPAGARPGPPTYNPDTTRQLD